MTAEKGGRERSSEEPGCEMQMQCRLISVHFHPRSHLTHASASEPKALSLLPFSGLLITPLWGVNFLYLYTLSFFYSLASTYLRRTCLDDDDLDARSYHDKAYLLYHHLHFICSIRFGYDRELAPTGMLEKKEDDMDKSLYLDVTDISFVCFPLTICLGFSW